MQLVARVAAWSTGVLMSLMVASVVFVEGWELPPRFECGGGDSCVAEHRYDIDWEIVNWELKPTRIACFEPNPGRSSVIVGPGDSCVSASGEREVRVTYEEMREGTQRRRLATLAIVAGVLAVTPAVAVLVVWRSRRRRTALPLPPWPTSP
jgi:hypothetical protein